MVIPDVGIICFYDHPSSAFSSELAVDAFRKVAAHEFGLFRAVEMNFRRRSGLDISIARSLTVPNLLQASSHLLPDNLSAAFLQSTISL